MELQGRRGPGAFQWNAGGWFGAQLGATLWMVLLGFVLLARAERAGAWLVLMALLANAVGWLLWRRRHALAPYPALQTLVAVCGLCTAAALLGIVASGLSLAATGFPSAWFLLMYPGLMLFFFLQERSALKAGEPGQTGPP